MCQKTPVSVAGKMCEAQFLDNIRTRLNVGKMFHSSFRSAADMFLIKETVMLQIHRGRFPFNKNSGLKFRKFSVFNGTVHSGSTTRHRALGYCSCKQDTKERYWGQQFCQMERNISVQPTEMTRPVKEDHLESWSRIFRSDQTEMVRSI